GTSHTCAVTTSYALKCWGSNLDGQLGVTSVPTISAVPVQVFDYGVTSVATGNSHTCAVVFGGVKCWGDNSSGQLGNSNGPFQPTPVDVPGLTSGVAAVTAGFSHTCALTDGGGVKCWGRNLEGQLGNGVNKTNSSTPVTVSGLSSGVAAVVAGGYHNCVL